MNSFVTSLLLLALLSVQTTDARHNLRAGRHQVGQEDDSETDSSLSFSSHSSLLSQNDLSLVAGEIQSFLSDNLQERHDNDNDVTFQQDVSGLAINTEPQGTCPLNGNVNWRVASVEGLESVTRTNLELVQGSEDYEPIRDFRGRIKGYRFSGLWKMVASYEKVRIGVVSQVGVHACGSPLDFTAFGNIRVNTTTINAALRIEGTLYSTTSDVTIGSASVVQKNIHFDTPPTGTLGGLSMVLPLDYSQQVEGLVQALFFAQLENLDVGDSLLMREAVASHSLRASDSVR